MTLRRGEVYPGTIQYRTPVAQGDISTFTHPIELTTGHSQGCIVRHSFHQDLKKPGPEQNVCVQQEKILRVYALQVLVVTAAETYVPG
jgi:hypothetical protein